jgi:hypothetical protein
MQRLSYMPYSGQTSFLYHDFTLSFDSFFLAPSHPQPSNALKIADTLCAYTYDRCSKFLWWEMLWNTSPAQRQRDQTKDSTLVIPAVRFFFLLSYPSPARMNFRSIAEINGNNGVGEECYAQLPKNYGWCMLWTRHIGWSGMRYFVSPSVNFGNSFSQTSHLRSALWWKHLLWYPYQKQIPGKDRWHKWVWREAWLLLLSANRILCSEEISAPEELSPRAKPGNTFGTGPRNIELIIRWEQGSFIKKLTLSSRGIALFY